jgi:acetolactate synthase-1/2/3 large subunit
LIASPIPTQKIVHIHPDPNESGRVYQAELAIACTLPEFALAMGDLKVAGKAKRAEWLKDARAAYVKFNDATASKAAHVNMATVISWLSENLQDDAIISNGAGNYTVWLHRFFRYKKPRTELAPISGSMGYGVPAAIAAKLRYPEREVIAFAGDGCFLMYPQELGTALQYDAPLLIIIVNNGIYGTIRMHQERRYPGRVVGTDIVNPDFIALAQSLGAHAERVERTEDFPAAYRRASSSGKPAVLELIIERAQLTPAYRIPG